MGDDPVNQTEQESDNDSDHECSQNGIILHSLTGSGSTEVINTLAKALIPGLIAELKSNEGLLTLADNEARGRKVTSQHTHAPQKEGRHTAVSATPTDNGIVRSNPSNAAGVVGSSSAAGNYSSNVAGSVNSNAAVWSNAAPMANMAQSFQWHQNHGPPFYPMYPMYPWQAFHPMGGPPQTTSDMAGPSSLGQAPPSTTCPSEADSESVINPFIEEDEREELLGDLFSDEEEQEEQEEGGEEEDGPPPAKKAKYMPSARTVKMLKAVTEKPLKNEKRKKITTKYPLPSCDQAHTPKLDEDISCIVPKAAKTYDRYLSKLQQFSLDALGPITRLHEEILADEAVNLTKAKEAVEAAIVLLGNATAHFSTERRKSMMKHLNKDLRPLCEGKFPNRGPYLFGENFGAKAKKTADNIRALKGVSTGKNRFSRFGDSNKGKQPQSRRYSWGKNTWGKSMQTSQNSVFNRLGPSKQASKFQRNSQENKKQ